MKKILLLLVLFLFLISIVYAATSIESCPTGKCPENDKYCIYYFYGQGCPHCANTAPVIEKLSTNYKNFTFYKLEIYFNSTNQLLFQDFVKRYGIEQAGIPAVFIGDKALIGDSPIIDNLENDLKFFLTTEPVCPLKYIKETGGSHTISPTKNTQLTIGAVILAALADSINPCAFSVLIFLLIYLTMLGSKKRMLKVGLAYIITVFIVYFLSGLGLFTLVQYAGITRIVMYLAAIISIIIGIINIKDFFWYGKGISLGLGDKAMSKIEKYVQRASISAAIILGILVSIWELPCTGGVYLAILSLLANTMTKLQALPWLLLYNFIFVLPLIIIMLLVYFGVSAQTADKFRLDKRRWMRLVLGLVMLGLGIAILAGLFG